MSKKVSVRERLEEYIPFEGITGVSLGTKAGWVIQAIFGSSALHTAEGLEVKDEDELEGWLERCSDAQNAVMLHRALVACYSP
jgi:hypothetical protein